MNFIMPMYFYFVEWQLRDLNRNIRTKIFKTYKISDQYTGYIRNWCFLKKIEQSMKNVIYKNVKKKTRNNKLRDNETLYKRQKQIILTRIHLSSNGTINVSLKKLLRFATLFSWRTERNSTEKRTRGSFLVLFSFLSYRLPRLFTFSPLFSIFFLFVSLAFPLFLPTYLLANARTCCIRMREVRFRGFLLTEFVATGVLVVGFIRCSRWRWSNEFIVVIIFPYVVSPGSYNHHTGPPWWLCSMDNDAEWKTSVFGWLISLREAIDVSIEMIPIRTLYELQSSLGNR